MISDKSVNYTPDDYKAKDQTTASSNNQNPNNTSEKEVLVPLVNQSLRKEDSTATIPTKNLNEDYAFKLIILNDSKKVADIQEISNEALSLAPSEELKTQQDTIDLSKELLSEISSEFTHLKKSFEKGVVLSLFSDLYPLYARNEKNKELIKSEQELKSKLAETENSISEINKRIDEKRSELELARKENNNIFGLNFLLELDVSNLEGQQKRLINQQEKLKAEINKIPDIKKLNQKAEDTRNRLVAIGGERVSIKTEDGAILDGIFLNSSSFRQKLAECGGKLTILTKENAPPFKGISFSLGDYEKNNQHIIKTLDELNSISNDKSGEPDSSSSGWSLVKFIVDNNEERIMLVPMRAIPDSGKQTEWIKYRGAKADERLQTRVISDKEEVQATYADIKPVSNGGTIILSFGKGGVYEQYKNEALAFLFLGLNVMCFNFRGVGLSEGIPGEANWKQDMETIYQYVKKKTGHADEQILIKSLCFSGGVGAFTAANHPNCNIILDQTYAELRNVVANTVKSQLEKIMAPKKRAEDNSSKSWIDNSLTQMQLWAVDNLPVFASNAASLFIPDFNVLDNLKEIKGKKAIAYVQNDEAIPFENVERNLSALASEAKVQNFTIISSEGAHGTSWLRMKNKGYELIPSLKSKIDAEYEKLASQLSKLNNEKNKWKEEIRETKNEILALSHKLEEIDENQLMLEEKKYKIIEAQIEILRNRINPEFKELHEKLGEISSEIELIQKSNAPLEEEIEVEYKRLLQEHEEIENKIKNIKEEYANQKNQLINSYQEDEMIAERKIIEERIQDLTSDVKKYKQEKNTINDQAVMLRREINTKIEDILDKYAGEGSEQLKKHLKETRYHMREFISDFLNKAHLSDDLLV